MVYIYERKVTDMAERNRRITGMPVIGEDVSSTQASYDTLDAFASGLKMGAAKQDLVETENGALVYATTSDPRSDFIAGASYYRNDSAAAAEGFQAAYAADPADAVVLAFQLGDIREGKGERAAFKSCLNSLAETHPDILCEVMPLIPEYSRWDYASELIMSKNPKVSKTAMNLVLNQLKSDIEAGKTGEGSISLLAKWLPSVQSKKPEQRKLAHKIMKEAKLDFKGYRKMLTGLREKLNIIEKYMSQGNMKDIDQEALTSKQQLKYDTAFMKHIPDERIAYLHDVNEGRAKMNTGVLAPHEVLHKYAHSRKISPAMETIWKMLPDKVNGNGNTLVIRDGSGSMTRTINDRTQCTCLEVATALTIYCAEKLSGPLKNKFITFSSRPEVVDLTGKDTLWDKMQYCYRFDDCSNTDLKKTFDMLLSIAKDNNLTQEQLPKNLLICSDMEFDTAMSNSFRTRSMEDILFTMIRSEWEQAGYELPTLVFWHLNANRTIFPEIDSKNGVINLSGFSTNTLDMVMEGRFEITEEKTANDGTVTTEKRVMTPYEQMRVIADSERYEPVREAVARGLEKENDNRTWFGRVVEASLSDNGTAQADDEPEI